MQQLGLDYGPKFQTIDGLRYSETEVLTQLKTNGDVRGFTIAPTLLDGALHSLAVGLLREDDGHLFLPVGVGRLQCFQAIENEVWCHARWKQNEGKIRSADLVLFSESGQVVAEIEDLKVQQVSIAALRKMSGGGSERLLYQLNWQRFRLPAANTKDKSWLVINTAEQNEFPTSITGQLKDVGHSVVELSLQHGATFGSVSDTQFTMCGKSAENWKQLFESLSSPEQPYFPQGIVWHFGSGESNAGEIPASTQANCTSLLNLIATLTEHGRRPIECGLQLITTDGIAVENDEQLDVNQSQYWGLGRVIGAEHPEFRCRLLDIASPQATNPETVSAVLSALLTETRDNQLVVRDGQFLVPRMKRVAAKSKSQAGLNVDSEGSFLITGGLGMLGRQAAKWLADNGASQVVLVSRRSPDEPTTAFLDTIKQAGCDVIVHPADLSSRDDVEEMFAHFGSDWNSLSGVIHAAGILDDGLLGDQTWDRFEKVLAPKVVGASLLHEFTQSLELDFFILYSSAASVLGSPGQSNYATANAFLDGLAWHRQTLGLPAISINWGPWSEGMADDERILKRLALQGITPLAIAEAHSAMEKMLTSGVVQATVMDVDWRRMRMGLGGESPAMLEGLAPAKQKSSMGDSELVSQLKRLRGPAQREMLLGRIRDSLQGILSTPDAPETDRPLIEMGLDSLMAVEFGTELQQMLGDQFAVGPTMLFDHPTIDSITDFVLDLVTSESENAAATKDETSDSNVETAARVREDVAIVGASCRFPGANNVGEFWDNLMNGVDSVCEIPADRWDMDRFYSADREPGKMYTREGGFLDDIAEFDAEFFNISDQEACWIDPQHRMLLENSYRALEDAGISPHPLADSNVGVFMGIMGQDYAFIPTMDDIDVIKQFQGAGLSHSAGVGRISYVFGFEGPSIAVDTASSSSLVALFQAVRSLQDGNCNMALAGGVNAILAPVNSLLMSKAGLLSPDGRCKSFSADANGFGRGEGCGVVVLKRLSDAQRDGDRIMAVVRGGAVVHNGFSGGITSPSGKAQSRVIRDALKDAGVAPSQVQYLEAHGTGTEFGDPMELGAAAGVYGKGRQPDQPLLVGSVKANISHLEAAGGVSGLIKTVLAIHNGVIPPQANFDEPSPHIQWQRMPIKMVTEATDWPETEQRLAGITALGLVGTNAHIVLSSAPDSTSDDENQTERPAELLVLSARNKKALSELATNYRDFIQQNPTINLADLCDTAASGRRHYEHRIALTVGSPEEAMDKLSQLANEKVASPMNGLLSSESNDSGNGSTNGNGAMHSEVASGVCKTTPKIAWVFDGTPSSDLNSIRELFATEPVFQMMIQEFDQRLDSHSSQTEQKLFRLQAWLESEDTDSQPSVPGDIKQFVLQAGLTKIWLDWGVEPDAVLGFEVGQYVAACVAGCLCFNDALILLVERSKVNSSDEESLKTFETFADQFNFYPPNLSLICSISGEVVPIHRSLGGSYWREHCIAEPMLAEAASALGELDCDYVLEIGTAISADHPTREIAAKHLASLSSNESVSTSLLKTLGQLYVGGVAPDFANLSKHWQRNRLSLPTYPFQKKRYWITEIDQHVKEKELTPVST